MKIKKKSKIIIIVILTFLISIFLLYLLIDYNINSIKVFHYETNYKIDSNSENLAKLCLCLKSSQKYDLIIKYYPKLLNDAESFNTVKEYLKPSADISEAHDELQCIYLFSYLYTDKYDTFRDKYIEYYPNFKALGYQNMYITGVVLDKTTTAKQLDVILTTLKDNLPNLENKPLDEVGNLNVQSNIYQRIGDSTNEKLTEQKSQEVMNSLKKK